jgi:hypothetical protein
LLVFFQNISFSRVISEHDLDPYSKAARKEIADRDSAERDLAERIKALEVESRSRLVCPNFLLNKIDSDASSNLRNWNLTKAESFDHFCAGPVKNLIEVPSSKELSKRLAQHALTKLGDSNQSLSKDCIDLVKDPERKNFFVAEFYSNMARLKTASLASLESLQAIDSVLGERSLGDKSCPSVGHSLTREGCEKLQACKPQGGLSDQAKELESIYPLYMSFKKEVDTLKEEIALSNFALQDTPPPLSLVNENMEKRRKVKEMLDFIKGIEEMYPALKGKAFQKTFDPSKNNFEEALKKQLKETRDKISSEFEELKKAISCMNGHSGECNDFDDILRKTPPLNIQAFKSGNRLTQEDAEVQAHLIATDCFQKVRKAKGNQDEAVSSFLVTSGLVVLTMGLSSYAGYGRLAYMSAQEAKLASTAIKASAEIGDIVSKAEIASRVAYGFDVLALGKGVVDAYRKCSKDLNQLTNYGLKKTTLKVSCAENPSQSSQAQLMADYRACVVHALFAGASSLILPKNIKKTIEGAFKGLTKGIKKGIGETGNLKDKAEKNPKDEGIDEYSGSRRPASE